MQQHPASPESVRRTSATKVTRRQVAALHSLSLRTVDELTRKGVLPYYKIGKSVRYNPEEVENVLQERYYVRAKTQKGSGKP